MNTIRKNYYQTLCDNCGKECHGSWTTTKYKNLELNICHKCELKLRDEENLNRIPEETWGDIYRKIKNNEHIIPPPKLKRDWKGLIVKSKVPLVNGWYEIPPGTLFIVRHNYKGLDLVSEPCKECGVRLAIAKETPAKLYLLILISRSILVLYTSKALSYS